MVSPPLDVPTPLAKTTLPSILPWLVMVSSNVSVIEIAPTRVLYWEGGRTDVAPVVTVLESAT